MATKAELLKLSKALATALRMQSNFHSRPDKENCWCGGYEHIGSVACLTARRVLKRYSQTVSEKP